ncbi:metalloregulator ArsR/SmtB family transcription factor [Glycomyces albus]
MLSTFEVLALPVRRDIVERLRREPKTVGELASELGLSQPLTSKHLRVLRDSGFVRVRIDAQRRWYELRPEPLREIAEWLEPYRWMWEDRLDRLGVELDAIRNEEEDP